MPTDFTPFIGRVVTLKYDSATAPGNCGIAAGTLTLTGDGDPHISANDHSGIIVKAAKVFHVACRDSTLPQFT